MQPCGLRTDPQASIDSLRESSRRMLFQAQNIATVRNPDSGTLPPEAGRRGELVSAILEIQLFPDRDRHLQ